MKEFYGYFNSSEGDQREYIDAELAEVFKAGFTDGVEDEDALTVSPIPSKMQVKISAGRAIVQGYVYSMQDDGGSVKVLDISPSGSAPRVDRIVLRLNLNDRSVRLAVVDGVPASDPKGTAPQRQGNIYELVLASIRVEPGTYDVPSAKIEDNRADEALCGYITASGLKRSYVDLLEEKITSNKSASDTAIAELQTSVRANATNIKKNTGDISALNTTVTTQYIKKADVVSIEINDSNDGVNTWTDENNGRWYKDYTVGNLSEGHKVIVAFSADSTSGAELKKSARFISSFYDTEILEGKIRVHRNGLIIGNDDAKIKPFRINAMVIKA